MKRCTKCEKVKPLTEFYFWRSGKDKHYPSCKECDKQRRKIIKREFGGLYTRWVTMKTRCSNPNVSAYKYYGSRGIKVCKEWRDSFQTFYKWAMENGHKKGLGIDRIDNDKGYYPENCRFVTSIENSRKNSQAKLNMDKAKIIRNIMRKGNFTYKEIRNRFNISDATIGRIKRLVSWT